MESWVEPETWKTLQGCFAHFDAEDSWNALFRVFKLFSRIARETAKMLGYDYPEEMEEKITGFAREQKEVSI